ncbi:neuropeptide FF receptor 2 [Phlebotomus argentipes]|uniref:neuropeptide FF receptor 2 n=1 Tax=Phlebotomus argentipes TaxID=94469 RepID=UPI0028936AE1|nr:neuropeptide FF receptor 2 [Phlebotomus argentipes]
MSLTDVNQDFSKFEFPREIWWIISKWEVVLKVITFIPVIAFGLIGNACIISIIYRNRVLRTPTNILIANMAAADLAFLAICPAMVMVKNFFQNYELGEIGCKTEGFLLGAFLLTAVMNLVAVSYDRLTAIVLPQEARLTIKGARIVLCLTWLFGVCLSLPLLIYRQYRVRIWLNFDEKWCTEDTSVLPMYWHVLISGLVWLPLGVMLICYSAIFYKLDRYEAKVLKRENPISVSYKTKVAKMLFIVLITFVILRGPFTALVFIRYQLLKQSQMNQISTSFEILWYIAHYLIFVNAAVNPIIYGWKNDNFRKAFRQTPIVRIFCKSPQKKKKKRKTRSKSIKDHQKINTCETRETRRKSTLSTIFRPFVVRVDEDTDNTKVGMLSTKMEFSDSGFIVTNMIMNDDDDREKPIKKSNTLNPENFI